MPDPTKQLNENLEKLGTAFDEFKKTNDERMKAVEKGLPTGDLDAKLGKIETDVAEFSKIKTAIQTAIKEQQDRIEELEARKELPGATAIEKRAQKHKDLFESALRRSFGDSEAVGLLKEQERVMQEAKDITIGTGAAGGFAVPEVIASEIEKLEKKMSPVRDLVKVVPVGTSDYKELVNIRGTTGGWVGESGTRTATATSQLRERAPTMGEIYAYPQASEWSLDDIFFNVENWITEEVAEEFAINEGIAVISGDGTSKPTGFLNTAPVATDDFASPLRSAEAMEYIPVTASPATSIAPDDLITLVYAVNSRYRANGTWAMNSLTTASIRKLKDNDNQYLWQPGLQAGEPDRLLGYGHATWENMPAVAADAHPVGFGNWRRFYLIVDRTGMRVTRDDVTNVGFVRFYVRQRRGGKILNNDAVKVLKIAAS